MRNKDRNNNRNATVTRAWARVRVPVPSRPETLIGYTVATFSLHGSREDFS